MQPKKPVAKPRRAGLTLLERAALMAGIVEIPFGVDKYLMYQEEHANFGAVAGYNISITLICLVVLYGLWALSVAKNEIALHRPVFGIPMLIYVFAVAISVFVAEEPHLARCELFLVVQAYLLFFYLANRISHNDLVFVICCFGLALLLQGLVMIMLRAMGPSMHGQRFDVGPIPFSVSLEGRSEGTLLSPTVAGSLMAIMMIMPTPMFLLIRDRRVWWFLALSLGTGLVGMMFTETRGAIGTVFLGTLIVGFALWTRGWLQRWTIILAVAAGLLGAIPLGMVIQKRIVSGDEGSAESRIHLTAIGMKAIAANPVIGYGAGNCHLACQEYADSPGYRSEWYFAVHCKYLLVWIETGLLGLIAFLCYLGNGLRQGMLIWFHRHPIYSPLGLAGFAGLAGHMTHMLVDLFNSRAQVQMLWVVLGVLAAVYRLSLEYRQKTRGARAL